MQKALALLLGVLASAEAYMVAPVAPRSRTCSRAAVQPEMILGYKLAGMVGTAAVVGTVVAVSALSQPPMASRRALSPPLAA